MRLPSERLVIYTWLITLVVLGLMAVPDARAAIQTVDDTVWQIAVEVESPFLTPIAETLDLAGGVVAMAVFAAVIAAVLWRSNRRVAAIVWLATMILGQGFSSLLKLAYERPRPSMPLHLESTWSFPSGHTLTAAIVAAGLTYLFSGGPVPKTIGWVWVVAMAASRLYLRVHWMSDVVAGALIGFAVVLGVFMLESMRLSDEHQSHSSSSESPTGP